MFAYCNIPSSCNYRRIPKTTRRCIKNSMLMISVIFKILLNSIVCFLRIFPSYFGVRGIIKVVVFSRFYGILLWILQHYWDFFASFLKKFRRQNYASLTKWFSFEGRMHKTCFSSCFFRDFFMLMLGPQLMRILMN